MSRFLGELGRVSLVAAMAGLAAVPPASAQNLFDMLFGGPVRRERDYPPAPPPHEPQRAKRVAAPKIAAPSYYDYKADSLVPVAFAEIAPAETAAAAAAPAGEADFRRILATLADFELFAERDVAKALVQHYSVRPHFIWVDGRSPNASAVETMRVLGEAASHGLDPADYAVSVPPARFDASDADARAAELARFEMALSARVLRYIRDAHNGRVDPNRLSGYHDFAKKPLDLAVELEALSVGYYKSAQILGHHPKGPEYAALRTELELLRAEAENDIVVDDMRMLVRPGGRHIELPKLMALIDRKADETFRGEHSVLIASYKDSEVYSDAMVPLIKAAQEDSGLKPDGIIGPRTVEALAGNSRAARIEKVLVALEQRRWQPAELPARRVFLNAPAYQAAYFEDGAETLTMRAIYGSKATQTYFFEDVIDYVEYQPYWGVPRSIVVNKYLPKLRSDPGYFDRLGFEVTDSKGRKIPSSAVNWGAYGANIPYHVRQRPGGANALGELKIMFPNKHAIYMHDTPDRKLFEREERALSNGCIRLADPRGMAAALLGTSVEAIGQKVARGHSSEKIPGNIPVHVVYYTAWPDAAGQVQYYSDVYDRDSRVMSALAKTETVRARR